MLNHCEFCNSNITKSYNVPNSDIPFMYAIVQKYAVSPDDFREYISRELVICDKCAKKVIDFVNSMRSTEETTWGV